MGLYDDIKCRFPLPVEGANEFSYQTKDTSAQFMDRYEIREDGTLWHEAYDHQDQSEAGKWERANPGEKAPEGMDRFMGCLGCINLRWEFEGNFTGEIRFYEYDPTPEIHWLEFSAYFLNGQLQQLNIIRNE